MFNNSIYYHFKRKCPECLTRFVTSSKNKKYCSELCAEIAAKTRREARARLRRVATKGVPPIFITNTEVSDGNQSN